MRFLGVFDEGNQTATDQEDGRGGTPEGTYPQPAGYQGPFPCRVPVRSRNCTDKEEDEKTYEELVFSWAKRTVDMGYTVNFTSVTTDRLSRGRSQVSLKWSLLPFRHVGPARSLLVEDGCWCSPLFPKITGTHLTGWKRVSDISTKRVAKYGQYKLVFIQKEFYSIEQMGFPDWDKTPVERFETQSHKLVDQGRGEDDDRQSGTQDVTETRDFDSHLRPSSSLYFRSFLSLHNNNTIAPRRALK